MANLQNPKRVNIQMDNMISQVHWGDEKIFDTFTVTVFYRWFKNLWI